MRLGTRGSRRKSFEVSLYTICGAMGGDVNIRREVNTGFNVDTK